MWSVARGDWPLTVTEGVVRCQESGGRAVVTFVTPEGKIYGLNAGADAQGLPRIDPIWRREPDAPGARADLSPVLDRGLRLCE